VHEYTGGESSLPQKAHGRFFGSRSRIAVMYANRKARTMQAYPATKMRSIPMTSQQKRLFRSWYTRVKKLRRARWEEFNGSLVAPDMKRR
jgi:hypothetical protein